MIRSNQIALNGDIDCTVDLVKDGLSEVAPMMQTAPVGQ